MKMSKWILMAVFTMFGSAALATAQSPTQACLTGPPERQLDCVKDDFHRSEAALNSAFKSVLQILADGQDFGQETNFLLENMRSRLRISQRAWVFFRESQCELEAFGSIDTQHLSPTHIRCQTIMNEARTISLRAYRQQYAKQFNRY